MRIRLYSDLHLEFPGAQFIPPQIESDVVVIAGDLHRGARGVPWLLEHFPETPVLYVLGNHEWYGETTPTLWDEIRAAVDGTNIQLLENERVDINGVCFLGCSLWTDFALNGNAPMAMLNARFGMNDYRKIRVAPNYRALAPEDTLAWHQRSRAFLVEQLQATRGMPTVVITHHAPTRLSLHPERNDDDELSAAYASSLEALMHEYAPRLWLHGHTHWCGSYDMGETQVVANARGYYTEVNPLFDPALVLSVAEGQP